MSSEFQSEKPAETAKPLLSYLEPITLLQYEEKAPEPLPEPPPLPRWRQTAALVVLLGFMSVMALVSASQLGKSALKNAEPMLPSSASQLVLWTAAELGLFAVVWVVAWLFSRASTDELFLRWRGTWQNIALGLGYSIALRLVPVVLAMFLVVFALLNGVKPDELKEYIKGLSPTPEKLVSLKALQNDPVYRFLMITWVSFIVAGLREELWRVAVIASFTKLLTPRFKLRHVQIFAVVVSSLFFGLAHATQGPLAIAMTALLGVALGAITIAHRSIWPAVIAHGAFDALSFLLLPLVKNIQV